MIHFISLALKPWRDSEEESFVIVPFLIRTSPERAIDIPELYALFVHVRARNVRGVGKSDDVTI